MRCGTCASGWKWSPQYLRGSSPIQRDMIFGGSLVLGLPAPSLQDPHQGLLSLSVPGLPASRFSQRSSSSLGRSSWAEGTGTVPPHQLSWGCHCLAHGSPGPAGPPHCLLGLCHHAWTPNSGFKGRTEVSASLPKCPFCGTSVSPQGQEAGRPLRPPPCRPGELQLWLPSTEHPPHHHLPVHSLALHWDPPALPQACTKRARAPQPGSLLGAPRRYRVTCFDCLTCNC